MRAPVMRIDRVGEGELGWVVPVVPLEGAFDIYVSDFLLEPDDRVVELALSLVEVGHELGDAALVLEFLRLAVGPFVDERDMDPAVQERKLAETLCQRFEHEVRRVLENRAVGLEVDAGPALARAALLRHRGLRDALL